MTIADKAVLVTGANRGIGQALVEEALRRGAKRVYAGTRQPLTHVDGRVTPLTLDVTNAEQIQGAVKRVEPLDVLINNAGIVRDAQLVKWNGGSPDSIMSEDVWDSVIRVNLKGVFLVTRAVVPHMIKGGGGVILSAASVVGLLGNFGQTNYVASKAGVIGMTRTWARELGKYKIRVNAVAPGFIATDMVKAMPPKILEAMVARTPLGRAGTPEDVANTYLWLASDQASFVHGAVISVDGGVVIGT